jgi:beta-N-acetylglucosaminidase
VLSVLFFGQTKVLAGSNDVTGFVTRLYEQCLYREPDIGGLNYWVNMLSEKTISGSNAAERFIYSNEFIGKNLSDDQFINVMYKTFFNRDADVSGKGYWTDMLQKGATRRFVFSSFANSIEFEGICNLYGITKGSVELYNNVDRYPAITGFTQRFYNKFQGRTPDLGGLTYWVDRLASKESSAADLAIGFASSSEFIGKKLSNEEYVATLYKAFMDREPDLSGQTYWINKLTLGYSRKFLLSRFLDSQEFKSLCSSYGISNGVIGTSAEDLPPLYTFVQYNNTLDYYVNIQMNKSAPIVYASSSSSRIANNDEVKYYMNPSNFAEDAYGKYMFMKLTYSDGITAANLNKVLEGRGILQGKGEVFLQAGKQYNVNPIYLVAHALLETGNGTSYLSSGKSEVSAFYNRVPILNEKQEVVGYQAVFDKAVEPKVIYNMYGIGAYDDNAKLWGSQRAYSEGWFSVDSAIIGGAKWISNSYIASPTWHQDTLYKMRWNITNNDGDVWHQYASDIGWAYKQINRIKQLVDMMDKPIIYYEVPVFKN